MSQPSRPIVRFVLLLLGFAAAAPAGGQSAAVPEPLEPWRDWVLHGEEHRTCPVFNGRMPGAVSDHVCAWPGTLDVTANSDEARFVQTWTLYAEAWVPLPGDAQLWPADVRVDGNAQAAVQRVGRPALHLPAGTHELTGRLVFAGERPASIAIPAETAIVALTLDGTTVSRPELDGGVLWLGLRPDAVADADRLDVVVHRRVQDTVPVQIETRIELDVAGQRREATLDGAALDGFVPMHLEAPFPAQLTTDGRLRVQVRPGRWVMTLTARAPSPPATLAREEAVEPWPADEVWSYEQVPRLRVSALEGAAAVDAERSGVPPEWRHLPAYRIAAGESVAIVERSRTDAEQANRLTLQRALWLDFDGRGYTALDHITGTMWSGWRLDMAEPYTMTMATVSGDPQLVTIDATTGAQGVEVRAHQLELSTTSRMPATGTLPVAGYTERFDHARTTLHVPPGYRILAAIGADHASGVWLHAWRLLDVFLLLVIAVAAWRLFGIGAGLLALLTIALLYHEPSAPRWPWLNLIVAVTLVRVAPAAGRLAALARGYRWVSAAVVLVLLVPFSAQQVRNAVHPQLERSTLERNVSPTAKAGLAGARADGAAAFAVEEAVRSLTSTDPRRTVSPGVSADSAAQAITRYQPGALVQTGPGLPDWAWTRHQLDFAGPVDPADTVRIVKIGPPIVALWRIASVLLAAALLWWLLAGGPPSLATARRQPHADRAEAPAVSTAIGLVATALIAALAGSPQPAAAQSADIPSPALLDELKARLTQPDPCRPDCAEVTAAAVTVRDGVLTINLDVAVQAATAVPVPGDAGGWQPTALTAEGERITRVFRHSAGTAWVALEAGVRRIEMSGPLPPAATFGIVFPQPPRRIVIDAPNFDIDGVVNARLPSGTLELTRRSPEADGEAVSELGPNAIAPGAIAPFVRVERRIAFDIDWRVTTTVTRVAPRHGAFTIGIDLLPNESVLTAGIDVSSARALVAFTPDQNAVQWESRLPVTETLTLTAPADGASAEVWQLAVSPIWHAETAGLPSSTPVTLDPAFYVPEFVPRGGESLEIALRRPEAASGDTIAFDAVNYRYDVGARTATGRLDLRYRSTRGMQHAITLPAGAMLDSVTIDETPIPLELDDGVLGLPVTPGTHSAQIIWRASEGAAWRTATPSLDLGAGASNVEVQLTMPRDRWVLATSGPRVGPAVLYWPELIALVLGAWGLGRLAWSPLRTHEWLLLGIGLSTFAWSVLGLFAVWAFAMSWRARHPRPLQGWRFNTLQVALGVLTVVALAVLIGSIPFGLLGEPNMHIASPVARGYLDWFIDRTGGAVPEAGVLSLSLWFYKAAMLVWALWLSFALLRWLPWAWRAFVNGGAWDGRVAKPVA